MIDDEMRRIQFLDRLYDFRPRRSGDMANVLDLIGSEPSPQDQVDWIGILHDLADRGAIMLAESMSFDGTSVQLRGPGRTEVEERRTRRHDRTARSAAARRAVLTWLAENPGSGNLDPIRDDPAFFFEGMGLDRSDLGSALSQLQQQGLVDGLRIGETDLMNAVVTAPGHAHLQQDLKQPRNTVTSHPQHDQSGGTTHNINFNGPVSGNVAWANQSVTQSATTTGLVHDELMVLIRAIAQAVPTLDLPRQDADSIQTTASIIEDELRNQVPNRTIVGTYLGRVIRTLSRQGSNALAMVLGAYTKHLLQQMGLPTD